MTFRLTVAASLGPLAVASSPKPRGGTACGSVWPLDTNYRSDARLLGALEHVFGGYAFGGYDFGDDAVRFHPVRAEAPDRPDGLVGAGPPLELRCVPDDFSTVPAARSFVVPDLVTEVVRLLESVQIRDNETPRALRPSDIAGLVRSNVDAAVYADALAAAGVPDASSPSDSIAESAAARQWRTLLRALERPAAIGPAKAAMLGWFIEGDATTVAALDDESTAALLDELRAGGRVPASLVRSLHPCQTPVGGVVIAECTEMSEPHPAQSPTDARVRVRGHRRRPRRPRPRQR